MAIDNELFKEAARHFWKDYRKKIEALGCLVNEGIMRGTEGDSIIALIEPYSPRILRRAKRIIPGQYEYRGEKIDVYIFPQLSDILKKQQL